MGVQYFLGRLGQAMPVVLGLIAVMTERAFRGNRP